MTPEDYRAKWGLPKDYPMVAPAYAEQRRTLAHSIGLGRKKVVETVAEPIRKAAKSVASGLEAARDHLGGEPEKKTRGRPKKAVEAPEAAEQPASDEA